MISSHCLLPADVVKMDAKVEMLKEDGVQIEVKVEVLPDSEGTSQSKDEDWWAASSLTGSVAIVSAFFYNFDAFVLNFCKILGEGTRSYTWGWYFYSTLQPVYWT